MPFSFPYEIFSRASSQPNALSISKPPSIHQSILISNLKCKDVFSIIVSLIVVINLLNRSFQGFDAGVAVDTPDRLIPKFTSRYCHSTIDIAVVLSVLA